MALGTGTKIGLGVVLAGAIGVLVLSDTGEGVLEYVYVDKLMGDVERYSGRTLKVHGIVVEGSITKKKGTMDDYRFVIHHGGERINVHFTDIPPDTFQEGGEVILTGRLTDDGTLFESDEMSAKCPSKYEEQQAIEQGKAPAPVEGQGGA